MIRNRKSLKKRETKKLLDKITMIFGTFMVKKVETGFFEEMTVYIFDNKIELVEGPEGIFPVLTSSFVNLIPSVVVDMGAIPYVCNGADIMAPGIVNIKTSFKENDIVVIRDNSHYKALAIGKANKSSAEIQTIKKGKVIKNIHYVGDKLWQIVS